MAGSGGLRELKKARTRQHIVDSAARLFARVYAVGVVVTAFLSNDATAVVLTPAVFAAARVQKLTPPELS